LRRERFAGTFQRTLDLPSGLDADRVDASLKDGVLTITLPKAEAAKPRRVPVKLS
jgi:HSP20 family protein